jgi:translation initiation factor IF-2
MAQIELEDTITVGTLAEKLNIPVTRLITELMKNGVLATVNERIDFDTAEIIVAELGLPDVEVIRKADEDTSTPGESRKLKSLTGQLRPPVVAVMGHVDHGKTSLLDAIRQAEVAKGEAGGITQHITAYQVENKGRLITFLDTPGHEAFAALRQHGARATDLVIIVVAADDGIKPQTIEAIRYARQAGVQMLVAINKMDKEGADPNKIKQQLADQDVLVEQYGGDTVVLEVSAKTKQGIPELLDMVLLVTDVAELKAENDGPATGLIIEAHMERGRGPVAIALVEGGTLNAGDYVVAGGTYAKVRNLESTTSRAIKAATASTPVVITGFKTLPEFGDEFESAKDEKTARSLAESMLQKRQTAAGKLDMSGGDLIRMINRTHELTELPIIVKADVQGSLTSVIDSLKSLSTEEVAVRVVGTGVGAIGENDIHTAHTTGAIIYGFNVTLPSSVKQLAHRDQVSIRLYKVIYELIDDTKVELTKLLVPEVVETSLGRLVVRGIFKTTKTEVICGGEVTKGKLSLPALARVVRGNETLAEVEVTNLKRGPQDAKEILEGEMCGMSFKSTSKVTVQEGDHIEFFTRETRARTL